MKLPQILSQVNVPSTTGLPEYRLLPGNFGQAIPQALEQAGQQAERTALSLEQSLAAADRRRAQLEEANQAATLTTDAELQVKQHAYNVKQGQDYQRYEADFAAGTKDIITQTLARTTNPNVQAAVRLRLTKMIGEEQLDLLTAKQKKYADVQLATLDRNLDNSANLAALSAKPEEIANYVGLGLGNIEALAQAGVITQVDAQKRKSKFLEDVSLVKARQDLQRDPEAFITEADQYTHIDPLKRQTLVEHAGKVVEQRAAKADRERRQQEAEEAKQLKAWQSQNSVQLAQLLRRGQANAGTVMEWAAGGRINEADQRFYLNYIDVQGRRASEAADRAERRREHEQDRAERNVLGDLKAKYYNGEIDEQGLMRTAKSGKYSGVVSGQIAEFAYDKHQQGKQEADSDTRELRAKYARMEDETKGEFLGYTPPSGSTTGKQYAEAMEVLWREYQEEARSLSAAWGSGPDLERDPWEIKRRVIDPYRLRARTIMRSTTETVIGLIPEPYRPAVDAEGTVDFGSIQQALGRVRDDLTARRLKEPQAKLIQERLRDVSLMRAAQDRESAVPAAPAGAAKKKVGVP